MPRPSFMSDWEESGETLGETLNRQKQKSDEYIAKMSYKAGEFNPSLNVFALGDTVIEFYEDVDGDYWFDAVQVSKALEYSQVQALLKNLENYDYEKQENIEFSTHPTRMTRKDRVLLKEGGLYKALFRSKKDYALEFTDYVAYVVLPSIRKHKMYVRDDATADDVINVLTAGVTADLVRKVENAAYYCGSLHHVLAELDERPDEPYNDVLADLEGY